MLAGKAGGPDGYIPTGATSTPRSSASISIGQLLAGGGVHRVVQDFDGLTQTFQVLSGLFQGDHATPPATSSTSRERRTSAVGISAPRCLWPRPLAGQEKALGRLLGPGMHRDPVTAGRYDPGAGPPASGAHPLPVQAVEGPDETVGTSWWECGATLGQLP